MTEQFAFQKIQRNGRAIQLYKSAPVALTCVVNGMRYELFACTGFPLDDDCRVGGRNLLHLLENRFEGSAIADDPLECAFGVIRSSARDLCVVSYTKHLRLRLPTRLLSHSIPHTSTRDRTL